MLGLVHGQFLSTTLGQASVLINDWDTLWDHCTVWELGLHNSCKFFSHLRKPYQSWGVLSLLFGAKLSYIFTFIPTNSIKSAKLRESIWSASSSTTQKRPLSLLQPKKKNLVSFNRNHPLPPYPSPGWIFPSIFQLSPTQYLSIGWVVPAIFHPFHPPVSSTWEGAGAWYMPSNKTQDYQPTWKIWEPGEMRPNSSGLSKETDRCKGSLIVPRLWFFVEFRQRKEVHSESLHGHLKTVDLKKSTNESCELNWGGGFAKWELQPRKQHLRCSSKNLFQRVWVEERSVYLWFDEGGIHAIKHIFFAEDFYYS